MSAETECWCEWADNGDGVPSAAVVQGCPQHLPECWCEWVDIGVGMQRVTDNPECPEHSPCSCEWFDVGEGMQGAAVTQSCPEHGVDAGIPEWALTWHTLRYQFAALAPVVVTLAGQMSRSMWAVAGPCECPSPTHRMSCGVSATPKVVTK